MRMFLIAALLAAAGCASAPPAGPVAEEGQAVSATPTNDCAVMGAVARERYGATRDDPPARVTLSSEDGERWEAECDWSDLGVNYVYDAGPTPPPDLLRMPHVNFTKPVYDGAGASLKTSLVFGEYGGDLGKGGTGHSCEMASGVAGWTVKSCTKDWER